MLNSNLNNSTIYSPFLENFSMGASMSFEQLTVHGYPIFFTNWFDSVNFPNVYGSGIYIPGADARVGYIIYLVEQRIYIRCKGSLTWGDWVDITPQI